MSAARNLKTLALWKKSYEKPDSILKSRDINLLTKVCIVKVRFFSSLIQTWQRRQCHPTPVLLPGKSHGRRSLEGCSPWGCWGSDMTELLHFPFSLLCIGEGNGNPLQCSCLENPRDGGAWWAAFYGVTQSRTQLKWLSSSSSIQTWDMEHKEGWELKNWCFWTVVLEKTLKSPLETQGDQINQS